MSKGHPQTPPNFDATLRCRSKRKPRRWVWSRTRGSSLSPSERERAEASRRRSRKCSMRKRRWSSGGGARGLAKARRVRRASLRMAGQEPPLRRPSDLPLRIRCHEAGQDADVVRACEDRHCSLRAYGHLARRARTKKHAGRGPPLSYLVSSRPSPTPLSRQSIPRP